MPSKSRKTSALPQLIEQKLYKTGQTRGASLDEIYQNRVNRNSTVLIHYEAWAMCKEPHDGTNSYEKGYIVLVDPSWYFTTSAADELLESEGLRLGKNAVLLFQRRADWEKYAPEEGSPLANGEPFRPAQNRSNPLGGTYIARVHSTTSINSPAIIRGYDHGKMRGAGIRVYEYASTQRIQDARLQLEALFWLCSDSVERLVANEQSDVFVQAERAETLRLAANAGLLDYDRLQQARLVNAKHETICPLCLNQISAAAFLKREEQAAGRTTWDNTITQISLFHLEELRVGSLQHKPYNLGWGHHHCNVVVKDAGILRTLTWMAQVLKNNGISSIESLEAREHSLEEAVGD